MKHNLFNQADGKTREVLAYIENLHPTENMDAKETKKFDAIKKLAMQEPNLDKKLEIVGYQPNNRPQLYDWVLEKQ